MLCLHGFPDDHRTFELLLPALAAAGYRAVAPAMRGYAPGCRPAPDRAAYTLICAGDDVLAIATALDAPRFHVIGHDWGAAVAWTLGARAPARLLSVCAMAVPHLSGLARGLFRHPIQALYSWYIFFFQLPWLPELVARNSDLALIRWLWRVWSPGWSPTPSRWSAVAATLSAPSALPAALAWYRALLALWRPASRASLALLAAPVLAPTLALTGARDRCLHTGLFDALDPACFPVGCKVERLHDAGHFLHLERPERVAACVIAHLDSAARREETPV